MSDMQPYRDYEVGDRIVTPEGQAYTVLNKRETAATLAGFLLDRIAEDEQRDVHERGCLGGLPLCECEYPTRLLVECEAKRAIIEESRRAMVYADQYPNGALQANAAGLVEAMGYLAAVYADHPDYRDEWRP